jgi:hypothetical protein
VNSKLGWTILALLLLSTFALTLTRTPETVAAMLMQVSTDLQRYSAFVHILFLAVAVLGLLAARARTTLFVAFIAFLSLSATVVAVRYAIVPNIVVFATLSVLIAHAYLTKNLNLQLEHPPLPDLLFGIPALIFGFWYLHWVQSPIWLNALLYSPLGAVNCPTLVTICGFLCLTQQPRSAPLEAALALATLYFGFFGLFRLGAYVDVVLIVCALYLIVRLGSAVGSVFPPAHVNG